MLHTSGIWRSTTVGWLHYSLLLSICMLGRVDYAWGQANMRWDIPPNSSFFSATADAPLSQAKQWLAERADSSIYAQSTLHWQAPTKDLAGGMHLTAQQYYQGYPVFDGFVRFHFSADEQLQRIQTHLLPLSGLPSFPLVYLDQLDAPALAKLREYYPSLSVNSWTLKSTESLIFHPHILRGQAAKQGHLAYAQRWEHPSGSACNLYWDTQTGRLLAHLQQHCTLFKHKLYDGHSARTAWESGQAIPTDFDQWKRWQISATEQTYNLFYSAFGRDSYDGLGATFQSRANALLDNCPNARWTGTYAQFCEGLSSDDVVAHEWAHAYTQYTSKLTYAWQSGAINEAYSDIWGEIVDLLNTEGNDDNEDQHRNGCDNSLRWKIAEDVAILDGPIRDLWSPNCHADPASNGDPYYDCDLEEIDAGGVHSNSGLVNRTFALLADGDGIQPGLGLTKAAHLFWQAQAHYLNRTSDFRTLAAALIAAYSDLNGLDLPELRLSDTLHQASGERLLTSDSLWLRAVLQQTGLERPLEQCPNYQPLLSQSPPAACAGDEYIQQRIFYEDFEQGLAAWQVEARPRFASQWEDRNWSIVNFIPTGHSGQAAYAPVPDNSVNSAKQSGLLRLQSPRIDLPQINEEAFKLSFQHYISLEPGDGARLTYRRNEDEWTQLPIEAFQYNAYQEILPLASSNIGNPLVGEWIYTGTDSGSNSGSWGTSIIDLSSLGLIGGDSLWIRWELGTDHSAGYEGWYIDDIEITNCTLRALPVEWLHFGATAGAHSVILDWKTATEYQNAGFFVERSIDGQHFYALDWIDATPHQTYSWEDKTVTPGQWYYYRLRQMDFDGQSSYSTIERVRFYPASDATVWVYPNPTREQLFVRSSLKEPIQEILLYSSTGILLQQIKPAMTSQTNIQLSLADFPAGTYLLWVALPGRQYQQLIIVR